MKLINKLGMLVLAFAAFTACQKVDELPSYKNGVAPVLTASTTVVAPAAADSMKSILSLAWSSPAYATDSSKVKYTIEIDSSGRNFSKAFTKTVTGALSTSFVAKDFNNILLGFGFKFGTTYDVDVRLTSSYNNNNDKIVGNTIKLKATPYKVPPKIALPSTNRLFITGGATDFDWTNPSSMPAVRELTRLEETKWGGIFHFNGNSGYLILQQGGNWDDKYNIADKNAPGVANAGSFGFKQNDDFAGNFKEGEGWYKLVLDFQTGTYTATKVPDALPDNLYTTGDATVSSWTPAPPEDQKFTQLSNGLFEITTPLKPGSLKILTGNGAWQPQFGGSSATGGTLMANYSNTGDPDAIGITVAGSYKITVNFLTGTYTVTKL